MKKQIECRVPGSIWDNGGHWHWRVKLPGDNKRTDHPLCMPGSKIAMSSSKPLPVAEAAAWRIWERHTNQAKYNASHPKECITVSQLCARYQAWSDTYYRHEDGTRTREAEGTRYRLRLLQEMFGDKYVADLEHRDMLALREALIDKDYSRGSVNHAMAQVKRLWAWGLEEDLIYAQTKAELSQVAPLKKWRSRARETPPVTSAPPDDVAAVVADMPVNLADMIRVQLLTGMRPAEICDMRWADIERRDEFWIYRPVHHKNTHRNHPRAVVIGPRARAALEPHEGEGEFCFSPKAAMAERYEAMRAARKSKVQPSQIDRSDPLATRKPGDKWDTGAYGRAINRKCRELGVAPWHPHQLRHNCATEVRRAFGLEAARAVLGHFTGPAVTDRYSFEAAEDELIAVAYPAMLALG